jgi:hypothetical protein
MMEEASLTSFMTSPYNTRAQKQLLYSRKENRKSAIVARMNKVKPQISLNPFELNKCLKDTIMAPPKLAEPGQIARSTRVQTRSWGPLEENEQQQPEIVDIDEILSPEEIPVKSIPILEEILQPQTEAME